MSQVTAQPLNSAQLAQDGFLDYFLLISQLSEPLETGFGICTKVSAALPKEQVSSNVFFASAQLVAH